MKLTIRQLRNMVKKALSEMKLGIADANPPGEAWRAPDAACEFDIEKIGRLIGRTTHEEVPDFETLCLQRRWEQDVMKNADWNWDDMPAVKTTPKKKRK